MIISQVEAKHIIGFLTGDEKGKEIILSQEIAQKIAENQEKYQYEESFTGFISAIQFRKDDFVIATINTDDNEEIKLKGSLYGLKKVKK